MRPPGLISEGCLYWHTVLGYVVCGSMVARLLRFRVKARPPRAEGLASKVKPPYGRHNPKCRVVTLNLHGSQGLGVLLNDTPESDQHAVHTGIALDG